MVDQRPSSHLGASTTGHDHPVLYALLWLTRRSEARIADFLLANGIRAEAIQKGMHLTVYHARRPLPGVRLGRRPVAISADVAETRFMVMAPGGENPRDDLDPTRQSVGLRLTRRNAAIADILALREEISQHETPEILGSRKRSNARNNAFGARNYQPHVKIVGSRAGMPYDLTAIGNAFRASLRTLQFQSFEVRFRPARPRESRP